MNLEKQIEAILLFKNEPVTFTELSKMLGESKESVEETVKNLQNFYKDRGMVIINNGDEVALGTHPEASGLIEKLQKDELSRDLGRAGLETLSIILYKGPISRREIDYIRGVNSSFILRNLLIRGLIERSESAVGERSFSYKPTLELLRFLGVGGREELPEFETAFKKIEEFAENSTDNPENPDA
ncbi:MAG: SMC-Scp complex subunit ScpB [Minisyncoccota bacterium]